MPTPDSSAVPCWGTPSVICWRGSSASPLCFDIIACCPTHPFVNHRRSTFSGRCCPTVEHSATKSHVCVVNICFQETFEDPSLQSFFPWISCSACARHFGHYNRSCYFYYKSTLRPVDRYWYGILNLLINQHIQKRVVVRVINMSVQNKSSRFNNNTLQSQLITLHNSLPTSQFRTHKFLMRRVLHHYNVLNAQTMGVAGWGRAHGTPNPIPLKLLLRMKNKTCRLRTMHALRIRLTELNNLHNIVHRK